MFVLSTLWNVAMPAVTPGRTLKMSVDFEPVEDFEGGTSCLTVKVSGEILDFL